MTAMSGLRIDARDAPRTSLYITATLFCEGASNPVRVRNISPAGALIEAVHSPSAGSLVQLVRGNLIVHALVAWADGGRCGLKFSGSVDVQRWRASPTNTEQLKVDEVVRLVKAGAVPLRVAAFDTEPGTTNFEAGHGELGVDLQRAIDLLQKMGDALAFDDRVAAEHGSVLQNLDIASQVVRAVKEIMSGDLDLNIHATKLAGLRRSADQALRSCPF